MNNYINMKSRHQQEVNDFPMFFAFSDKQFEKGIAKKSYSTGGIHSHKTA